MTFEEQLEKQWQELRAAFPDLSTLKLLHLHTYAQTQYESYCVRETVKPDKVITEVLNVQYAKEDGKFVESGRGLAKQTNKRYLCVNGPNVGEKLTEKQGQEHEYILFNRNSRWRGGDDTPSAILAVLP